MVGEILTIVPPILVNENVEMESCGDVTCYPSEGEVYAYFEDWFADEAHFAVDSRGQVMKLFNIPALGLQLRGIGVPDRPDLFRRYFLAIHHPGDLATISDKEKSLSHDEICKQAMEFARADTELRNSFTLSRWFKELFRDIGRWVTGRG